MLHILRFQFIIEQECKQLNTYDWLIDTGTQNVQSIQSKQMVSWLTANGLLVSCAMFT